MGCGDGADLGIAVDGAAEVAGDGGGGGGA